VVHVKANDLTYGEYTWSQVQADVHLDGDNTQVQIDQAVLCGISTPGALGFSPQGVSLRITPTAADASLHETANCFLHRPVKAVAKYDLTGEINLLPTRENPAQFLSGHVNFSSDNGRITYANVLMKIFSILNITEVFTGGKSDLSENGYGYSTAAVKATLAEGKVQLTEILLDGNSLKITGQGTIDLRDRTVDIILLTAPLKTVDRIVNKLPMINYIIGGSLISIPLKISGPINDPDVTPMSPAAVGKGVLHIMERTLKSPFKLVQSASELTKEELSGKTSQNADSPPFDSSTSGQER
jgi:hypothetical protein